MKYEAVIGLETHIQLNTLSKAFCGDATTFGNAPNSQVSTRSLGHPGTLPFLNKTQVMHALKLGLALGCDINLHTSFDRKNYFYTDLPKGYQITQDYQPICVGGSLPIRLPDGSTRLVRLHHIHMEEDAGKSIHDRSDRYSEVDLNRAGVPLLEVVSEPDLHSAAEVDAFMNAMRQLVRWLGISDGNMEQGSMRCDCNVSIRPAGSTALNARCEIKNMNSMRYARTAIDYEIKRQTKIVESGGEIVQQTLQFDPKTGKTTPLRSKENAHDYRYFPDPDLPPLQLQPATLERIKATIDYLPWELHAQLVGAEYGLSDYDARILTEEKETASLFLHFYERYPHAKAIANFIINKLRPYIQNHPDCQVPVAQLVEMLRMIDQNLISHSVAYQSLFPLLLAEPKRTAMELAEAHQLLQSKDDNLLSALVTDVMAAYPEKVKAYQKGKKGLLGFFMGEIMKRAKGRVDPKVTNRLLQAALEETTA